MNEVQLATCQCIISHPSKPKFMVVKHSTGWMPPTVRFPAAGFVGSKAQMIAAGIMNKYGLKVTVLRHLVETANNHYIELEQQSGQNLKNLKSVWVGSKEYKEFRNRKAGQSDPLADWLREAEKGWISPQRPAWERKRWFKKAENWIQHELDRLQIQVTGSVQQEIACWPAHTFLRVNTTLGVFLFKASYPAPPNEAAITLALAGLFPDLVPQPLASDVPKTWLLMNGYHENGGQQPGDDDALSIARKFANFQLESSRHAAEWKKLEVPDRGLAALDVFLGEFNELHPVLQSGENSLSAAELERLQPRIADSQSRCRQLAEYALPATLVHPGFSASNVIREDGSLKVLNWSDVMISHPFFSALVFLQSLGEPGEQETEIRNAWFAAFADFESPSRLEESFELASRLLPVWQLYRWGCQMDYIEPGSVSHAAKTRVMQRLCRDLIAAHEPS